MGTHARFSDVALGVLLNPAASDFRSREQLDGAAPPDDAGSAAHGGDGVGGMNKYKIKTLEAKVLLP
jgi:hypothetical protein